MADDVEEFQYALRLRDDGNLDAARDLLITLSERRPDSAALFAVLGDLQWNLDDLEGAITSFKTATQLAPKSEAASLGLFHCLWESDRLLDAIDECNRFLAIADAVEYRRILTDLGH